MHLLPPGHSNGRLRLLTFYERIATHLTVSLVVLLAVLSPVVVAIAYFLSMSGLVYLATFTRIPPSN